MDSPQPLLPLPSFLSPDHVLERSVQPNKRPQEQEMVQEDARFKKVKTEPTALQKELALVEDELAPLQRTQQISLLNKLLACPICRETMTDPQRLLSCDHCFCFACIVKRNQSEPKCPLCQSSSLEYKPISLITQICQTLCPRICSQCCDTYYGDLNAHMRQSCSKAVPCPSCDSVFFLKDLGAHCDTCPLKLVNCAGCRREFPRNKLRAHQSSCEGYTECCGQMLLPSDLAMHLSSSLGCYCVAGTPHLCTSLQNACKHCGSNSHSKAHECPQCVQCSHCGLFHRKDFTTMHLRNCNYYPLTCDTCSSTYGKPMIVPTGLRGAFYAHERVYHRTTPFLFAARWAVSPFLASTIVTQVPFNLERDACLPNSSRDPLSSWFRDALENPTVNKDVKVVSSVFLLQKTSQTLHSFDLSVFRQAEKEMTPATAVVPKISCEVRKIDRKTWTVAHSFPRHTFYALLPKLDKYWTHLARFLGMLKQRRMPPESYHAYTVHSPEDKKQFLLLKFDVRTDVDIGEARAVVQESLDRWKKTTEIQNEEICEIVAIQPRSSEIVGFFKLGSHSHGCEDLRALKAAFA